MNVLIINGPCGAGKTSVAHLLRSIVENTVLISVDELRPTSAQHGSSESFEFAVRAAEEVMREALDRGYDVIIERMIYDERVLDSFAAIALTRGANVAEVLLWANEACVLDRSNRRGYPSDGLFSPEKCSDLWKKMDVFRKKRPQAILIDTTEKTAKEVTLELLERIS